MHLSRCYRTVLVGSVIALVAGCGGDSRFAPVSGVVTLDGEPVANATVAFLSKEGGRRAFGTTGADGAYELSTLSPGDGAVPGEHLVTISAVDIVEDEKTKKMTSELGSLASDLPLPPPKKVWRLPQVYSEAETSGLKFTVERGSNQADFPLTKDP